MAVSCEPVDLAASASCFMCLTQDQREAIKTYLLAVLAGGSLDQAALLAEANCFMCLDAVQHKSLQNYLLCQILNNCGGTVCASLSGAGDPTGVTTPDFIGQLYHDTVSDSYYRSTGLTDNDWIAIIGGDTSFTVLGDGSAYFEWSGIIGPASLDLNMFSVWDGVDSMVYSNSFTSLVFSNMTDMQGTDVLSAEGVLWIGFNTLLQSLGFPQLSAIRHNSGIFIEANDVLDSIDCSSLVLLGTVGGAQEAILEILDNPLLTSVDLGLLASIEENGKLRIINNDALQTISLPSLGTTGHPLSSLTISENGTMSSISLPAFLPVNGMECYFVGNALTDVSVNHILARCVANAGYISGTVNLSGGTNSAPSGQGIVDKATLIVRGCTVTTN